MVTPPWAVNTHPADFLIPGAIARNSSSTGTTSAAVLQATRHLAEHGGVPKQKPGGCPGFCLY